MLKCINETLFINYEFEEGKKDFYYYTVFNYPGGEIDVKIKPEFLEKVKNSFIHFTSRIRSSEDFLRTYLIMNTFKKYSKKGIQLFFPYLPYSRADREFSEGSVNHLEQMIQLFTQTKEKIFTVDVHSDNIFNNSFIQNSIPLEQIISTIGFIIDNKNDNKLDKNINIIFPDEGAKKRYIDQYKIDFPEYFYNLTLRMPIRVKYSFFFCNKKRDVMTGKFLGFDVPKIDNS